MFRGEFRGVTQSGHAGTTTNSAIMETVDANLNLKNVAIVVLRETCDALQVVLSLGIITLISVPVFFPSSYHWQ